MRLNLFFLLYILIVSSYGHAQEEAFENSSVNMATQSLASGPNANTNSNIGEVIIDWILRGASFSNPENTLFGALSLILNSIVLAFALVVLSKHGLQYATLTATKGVPGGQQLSGGIIAIRSSLAVTLLTPIIANGFSPIQAIVKSATELGAYIGDEAVLSTSKFLKGEGGGSATISPVSINGTSDVVWQIMLAESCQEAFSRYYTEKAVKQGISPPTNFKTFSNEMVGESSIVFKWGVNNPFQQGVVIDANYSETACGTVSLEIPNAIQGDVYINGDTAISIRPQSGIKSYYNESLIIHHDAIIKAQQEMATLVTSLFADQVRYGELTGYRTLGTMDVSAIEALYKSIKGESVKIKENIPVYVAEYNDYSVVGRNGLSWEEELNSQGFAALGPYYWTQMKINLKVTELQKHLAKNGSPPVIFLTMEDMQSRKGLIPIEIIELKNNEALTVLAERLAQVKLSAVASYESADLNTSFDAVKYSSNLDERTGFLDIMNAGTTWVANLVEDQLLQSTQNDIILKLSTIGIVINGIAEWGVLLALVGGAIGAAVKAGMTIANPASLLTGMLPSGDEGGIIKEIIAASLPILLVALAIGLILQYVLPAIPLIKWIASLQSWAIMMFIAFVYAPIWMLSTAAATGEEWVSQKMHDGFIIMAELILRPILMVAGYYAAMSLMVVADIGARMAWPYLVGMGREGVFGPIGLATVIIISVYLVYKLVMRSFDLIIEVPDFVIGKLGSGSPLGSAAKDDASGGIAGMVIANESKMTGAGQNVAAGAGGVANSAIEKLGASKSSPSK